VILYRVKQAYQKIGALQKFIFMASVFLIFLASAQFRIVQEDHILYVLQFVLPIVFLSILFVYWFFLILFPHMKLLKRKIRENKFLQLCLFLILMILYGLFGLFVAWQNFENLSSTILIRFSIAVAIPAIYSFFYLLKFDSKKEENGIPNRNKTKGVLSKTAYSLNLEKTITLLGVAQEPSLVKLENGFQFSVPLTHKYALFEKIKVDRAYQGLQLRAKFRDEVYITLDIRKRDSIFLPTKDVFSISMLENVYVLSSPESEIWKSFLRDEEIKLDLLALRPHLEFLSIKGQYFEALVYYDRSIIKLLDWLLKVNPTLQKKVIQIQKEQVQTLFCYNCGDIFDPMEEVCEHCGAPRPICIVCFQNLHPSESRNVVKLPCCEVYAHQEHIITWLRKNPICPNCKSNLSQWLNELLLNK